jgi:hypothetical protein
MTSCRDLRHLNGNMDVEAAFSRLVSGGKPGYKAVIEKDKPIPTCPSCRVKLLGDEKFCPECGTKTGFK